MSWLKRKAIKYVLLSYYVISLIVDITTVLMSDSYVSLLYGKNARVSQSMSLKPQNGESVFYNLHLLCQKCSLKAKKGGLNFCETSTCKIF